MLDKFLWVLGILLMIGMTVEQNYVDGVSQWFYYLGAGMLTFFNADPSLGTNANPYIEHYTQSWADSKAG